jgi:hypothetical protein
MLMELFPTHLPQPSPVDDDQNQRSQEHPEADNESKILESDRLQVIVAQVVEAGGTRWRQAGRP